MTFSEDRKNVSELVRKVRIGELCVREALLLFPPDCEDSSIQAAYHALIHYEADEDLRRRDNLYKEEQDDYIEFIAFTLEKGEPLPDNIIKSYNIYYKSAPIPHAHNTKGFWKSFLRFLNLEEKN